MNRNLILALLALSAAIIGVSLYLRPGDKEIALMELEDRNFKEAQQKFDTLQQQGDTSVNVVFPLSRIYQEQGDMKAAIAIMEKYVREHPKSYESLAYLGQLYQQSQMPDHYLRNLEERQKLRPSGELLHEMIFYYDLRGQFDKEAEALAALIQSPGYTPSEEEYYKAATYYAMQQQNDEALKLLREELKRKKFDVGDDTIDLALDLMMQPPRSDPDEVINVAETYAKKRKDMRTVTHLSSFFRDQNRPDFSLALIMPYEKMPDPQGEWLVEWANAKLMLGQEAEVMPVIMKRFREGSMPPALTEFLADNALKRKDYALLQQVVNKQDPEMMPPMLLMRIINASMVTGKKELLNPLAGHLSADYLRDHTMVAGMFDVARRQDFRLLDKVVSQPDSSMENDEKILLIEVYSHYGRQQQVFALLKSLPFGSMMTTYDPDYVASLYADMGEIRTGLDLVEKAMPRLNDVLRRRAEDIRGLLSVAAGDGDAVIVWMKKMHPVDTSLLTAYYFAQKYHRDAIGLMLAQEIYTRHPTNANRIELAQASVLGRQYDAALRLLGRSPLDDKEAVDTYFEALVGLVHQRGSAAAKGYDAFTASYLSRALNRPGNTDADRRQLAYTLLDAGIRDRASYLFAELAQNAPAKSPDVQAYIDSWPKPPTATNVAWLKARAMHARGDEQADWLEYLEDTGQRQAIIEVADATDELSDRGMDIYLNALGGGENKKQVAAFLTREFQKNLPLQRLHALVQLAIDEDLIDIAEGAIGKLLERAPDDSQSLRALATLYLERKRFAEAEPLLARYLKTQTGDAEMEYAYADILWRKKHYDEANNHYNQALNAINLKHRNDFDARSMLATIYFHKGDAEKSIQLFKELLSEKPEDKQLRADYVDVLLQTKRYAEAQSVLQGNNP
jgi:tetratricopeptide (TPR) repeat protein